MIHKFKEWFNERLPLGGLMDAVFKEKIPGGASFFYTLGSATLFVFALQVLTGIWQLFYYVPTIDHAYASVSYLRINVPYGWLINGIHYWGANVMAILVALHIIRVFIWGAYKKPRELTWLIGVLLLLLVAGLIFTGAALPWDERGYWATEVGTSIAGTVPLIGSFMQKFLVGGESMGQLTLSRFFAFHAVIVPVIAIIFIIFHLVAFRKHGSVGPWKESKRIKTGDFWPDQVAIDLIVSGFIFVLIVWLSAYYPPPFTGPADPSDTAFEPKPEWNFLFLYQLLKFLKGPLEVLGSVGIPTVIIILFVIVPFIDRKASYNPVNRPGMMIGGFIFVGFVLTFTIIGYNSKPPGSSESAGTTISTSTNTVQTSLVSSSLSPEAQAGKIVFNNKGCNACHTISGVGGKIGPNLTNEIGNNRSMQWLIDQLKHSKTHYPTSVMPEYSKLTQKQLDDLIAYLNTPHQLSAQKDSTIGSTAVRNTLNADSIKGIEIEETRMKLAKLGTTGEAASIIGNVGVGKKLFETNCVSCHGQGGIGGIPNFGSRSGKVPALNPVNEVLYSKSPKQFAENIDKFIQHGSVPAGSSSLRMFAYGDSYTLTQPEIANIEAYILDLNNVNRAQIKAPDSAFTFFYVVFFVYLTIILLTIIFWIRTKRSDNQV